MRVILPISDTRYFLRFSGITDTLFPRQILVWAIKWWCFNRDATQDSVCESLVITRAFIKFPVCASLKHHWSNDLIASIYVIVDIKQIHQSNQWWHGVPKNQSVQRDMHLSRDCQLLNCHTKRILMFGNFTWNELSSSPRSIVTLHLNDVTNYVCFILVIMSSKSTFACYCTIWIYLTRWYVFNVNESAEVDLNIHADPVYKHHFDSSAVRSYNYIIWYSLLIIPCRYAIDCFASSGKTSVSAKLNSGSGPVYKRGDFFNHARYKHVGDMVCGV